MIFIAEVKTKSPFGYQAEKSWEELYVIAKTYGDWIAVHTETPWGGRESNITRVMIDSSTFQPVLAKGIHASDDKIQRMLDLGATYVLVVGRLPAEKYWDRCIMEPNSLDQLISWPLQGLKIMWNARDLRTGNEKIDFWNEARSVCDWIGQASFIQTPLDVYANADAILVGQSLATFAPIYDINKKLLTRKENPLL